ncbi:XRE family transcriptional regulator [bacterium]|nr:MAG: XRE family transcriptional regulator [bacterium]
MPSSVQSTQYDAFRTLLITARVEVGLSQQQLADRLKKPQSFVSKYERGERRIDVVEFKEIADALALDPLTLLGRLWH